MLFYRARTTRRDDTTVQTERLIHASWIVPVEDNRILHEHSLAIDGGRIAAILPRAEAVEQFEARDVIDLPGHVLMPGLVNTHTHSPMTLFRGLADDLPLMTWLNEHIWPAEVRFVHEEFVADGSRLAVAEMLRSGTTCFNDMYFFPDVTARVASQAGMRAVVGLILVDFASSWAENADGYLDRAIAVHDQFRDDALITTAFAPHAPYSVSDAPLQRLVTLANELELPVHMHVHETEAEIDGSLREHGCRPIERLERLGLLSPSLVAVHMTHVTDAEIAQCATAGVNVVHCPQSNLKLASGHCPVSAMSKAGINVALGSDGAASNNDLDLLAELQTAALLAKGIEGDACALPAMDVLRMATLNGAQALGLADEIGSLRPGKSADIVAVDLSMPETQPVYNPASQLVYAAGREQVRHVWVRGQQVLQNRTLTGLDLEQSLARARAWQQQIDEAHRP